MKIRTTRPLIMTLTTGRRTMNPGIIRNVS